MVRLILIGLVLFSLPFITAWLWLWWVRRFHPNAQRQWHFARLTAMGVGLVLVGLLVIRFGVSVDEDVQKTYVPPVYEDGQIVPGHFE